ncbi:hypothetical protein [Kineosporia sp. A_224]|uniref:hypothetical protein n=1 Tax=Kineosporia sp. A_224 TaxID=1962180 RepID=UPI00130402C8|nr:hypothetical protein [Kineosporia sp. A_224]
MISTGSRANRVRTVCGLGLGLALALVLTACSGGSTTAGPAPAVTVTVTAAAAPGSAAAGATGNTSAPSTGGAARPAASSTTRRPAARPSTSKRPSSSTTSSASDPGPVRGQVRIDLDTLGCVYVPSASGDDDAVVVSSRVVGDALSRPFQVSLRAVAAGRDDQSAAVVRLPGGSHGAPVSVRATVFAPTAPYTAQLTLSMAPQNLPDDADADNRLGVSVDLPFPRPAGRVPVTCYVN